MDALLDHLPPRVLVCGKGGVGKTTCASALALCAAERGKSGERTLLLSTDPARSLGDAIGTAPEGTPTPLHDVPGLFAMQLDPAATRSRFLAEWRGALIELFDRGTYLTREESASIIDAALPGIDESMALLTILDIEDEGWTRLVVDTAPTGHTLRLLELPESFEALLALLDAMQEKHRFMVRALTHRYREDDVDRFLESMRTRLQRLRRSLADPERYATVLVVRAEELVVEESVRYAARLQSMGLAPRALVANALSREMDATSAAALRALERALPGVRRFHVARLERMPAGLGGIRRWGEAVRAPDASISGGEGATKDSLASWGPAAGLATLVERIAPLTIVAGKGGVGKTTTACALAIALADRGLRTLIVSTDPAPSVADALAQPIGDEVTPVEGVERLSAQQLDASAAFARLRERFREQVDRLFESLTGGTMDVAYDRRVARDLLALAPPGLDELYALDVLGERLAERDFARIVVDPAPTGHLLRLLELPSQAIEWTHRLLRLMLEYRDVVPLGEASAELLAFAQRTRSLDALLHDPRCATAVVVALDEPLVRRETARLAERVGELGVSVAGVIWNRAGDAHVTPLPLAPPLVQFESPVTMPAPRGAEALREWSATWRSVPIGGH